MTRNLKWKSNFGENKVVDIKMKEETSKYEKSWRKMTVEGNKRVKATFIWKKIKLINDVWRIEKTWIIYIYINMKIQCSCFCKVTAVVSNSVQPHRRQPTRLYRPWDSPGKNTGVGCHFLLQCMKVKSLSRVWLFTTPWTVAYQASPSMGFSRQEYWSGLLFHINVYY